VWGASRYLLPLVVRYVRDHRVLIPGSARISLGVQAEQIPLRRSRITVDASQRDRFGIGKVCLEWAVDGREVEAVRDFAVRTRDALAAAKLAEVEIEPAVMNLEPELLRSFWDTNHPAGGCRMGASEKDGVVDRDLKVFGTTNLHIVGASVYPTSSSANVTLTALAFAARLGDHLAGAH
jgi:choline dehydrogenase-like flavoprotein